MGTQSCHRSEGRVKRIVQGHVQIDFLKAVSEVICVKHIII